MRRLSIIAVVLLTAVAVAGPADAKNVTGTANADVLMGTKRDDRLSGSEGADSLLGGKGDDVLLGGNGANILVPGPGRDLTQGGDDAESIVDTDGKKGDKLKGGDGDDFFYVADGKPSKVVCGDGVDTVFVDPGIDVTDPQTCNTLISTDMTDTDHDRKFGTAGNDTITAEMKTFVLVFGLAGDDILNSTNFPGTSSWFPGPGSDTVNGGEGTDYIYDDDGTNDNLNGANNADVIVSIDGAVDTVNCGPDLFVDYIYADANDVINGCMAEDNVYRFPGANPPPE